LLAGAALLLGGACRRAPPAPSYSGQVSQILERRCVACHGSSPAAANVSPALDTAQAAQRVAAQVALAVERRRMPPWGADGTGTCGRFADAAWLEDREVNTLRAWAQTGAPLGPPATEAARSASAVAPGPFAWLLTPAPGERRLDLSTQFTPGLGPSATRCFRSDAVVDGRWALGALGLRVDPPLGVQQLWLHTLSEPRQLETVEQLEAEDPEPGWSCYGGSRVPGSQLVASWSWLNPLQRLPAGIALRGGPRLPLVLQLRYNLLGAGLTQRPVRATAELVLRPLEHGAELRPLSVPDLRLTPGQRRVEVQHELALPEHVTLLGIVPQLHGLGRGLLLERQRGEGRDCLASFAHWEPSQQQLFRYRAAWELDPGDRLRLSCVFDTSSRSEAVLGGENIDQEQCQVFLYVAEQP
jgi:hypothetical protein